jgi:hypothetical protein
MEPAGTFASPRAATGAGGDRSASGGDATPTLVGAGLAGSSGETPHGNAPRNDARPVSSGGIPDDTALRFRSAR